MKLLIVTSVLVLLNVYIAARFRVRLNLGHSTDRLIFSGFILFFALQMIWPLGELSLRGTAFYEQLGPPQMGLRISFHALGIFSVLLAYTLVADALTLPLSLFFSFAKTRLFHQGTLALLVIATTATIASGLAGAKRLYVRSVDLPIKNLPTPLEGLRIAQISDIHIGAFITRPFVQEIVDKVNALKPDMIVLTGDIADALPENRLNDTAQLNELSAPMGKYYVTGNHEYYWDPTGWIEQAAKNGIQPLINSHKILQKDGATLVIAGVPDPTALGLPATEAPNVAKAIAGAPEPSVKILLSHQPKLFKQAIRAGFDVQLSGHTHAGQYFPFTLLIGFFHAYTNGLYDVDGLKLFVNTGTGFWGPPLRTGCGEITLLTLKRDNAAETIRSAD